MTPTWATDTFTTLGGRRGAVVYCGWAGFWGLEGRACRGCAGAGCGRTVRVCRSFGNLGGWPKAEPNHGDRERGNRTSRPTRQQPESGVKGAERIINRATKWQLPKQGCQLTRSFCSLAYTRVLVGHPPSAFLPSQGCRFGRAPFALTPKASF